MNYSKHRTAVLTFILGIVSVTFFKAEYEKWTEIKVDLPKVESSSPIIIDIYPTKRFPRRYYGGSGHPD